jgi:hypothetical protein
VLSRLGAADVTAIVKGNITEKEADALPVLAGVKLSLLEKLKLPELKFVSAPTTAKQTLELLGVATPEAGVPLAPRTLETRRPIRVGCAETAQLVAVMEVIPVGNVDGAVIVTEELYVPL